MKKIEQKIYVLGTQSGQKMNSSDRLTVCINGVDTKKSVEDFFKNFKQTDEVLKGQSLIGEYPINDYRVIVKEDLQLSLWNKNSEEEVFFFETKFPVVQTVSDVDMDTEEFIGMLEALKPKNDSVEEEVKEEEQVEAQIEETDISISGEEKLDELTETDNELIEAGIGDQSEEQVQEDADVYIPVNCEAWEEDKKKLIETGYHEYKAEDFRLMFKPADSGNKPKALIVLLVDNDAYQNIPIDLVEKEPIKNYYKFNVGDEFLILENDSIRLEK